MKTLNKNRRWVRYSFFPVSSTGQAPKEAGHIAFSVLRPIFIFLSLFVGSGLLAPGSAFARQAIVTQISGTVEIQEAESNLWRKAAPKMIITEGQKIRTGKRSKAVILFDDGSRTEISAGTVLQVSQLMPAIRLKQGTGRTRSRITKGTGFALRTPTAVCSVRGTDFAVEVSGEDSVTSLNVFEGVVNGLKTMTGESKDVGAGQSLTFTGDGRSLGDPMEMESGPKDNSLRQTAKKEVGLDMTREQIQAAAAEEMKLAEYMEGKSLIDVNGLRVRLEEYILRKPKEVPAADRDKAFKFVVLNTRENRFDYFTYKGIFNKTLPDDLALALNNVSGRKLGEQPEYYLTQYEMSQSNLTDAIKDMADGGHLVEVTFDGTDYTLKAHDVAADGKAGAVTDTVNQSGTANGKTYDPVADLYKNSSAGMDGVYDPSDDSFRQLKSGETLWRTVFNRYGHLIGASGDLAALTLDNVPAGTLTQPWFQYYSKSGVTNIATLESLNNADLTANGTFTNEGRALTIYPDQVIGNASFKYLNGKYAFDYYYPDALNVDNPSFSDALHQRLITYYPKSAADVPFEQYDTYIFSNEGQTAPISAFANATSGKTFKEELLKWNYQQITRSSAFLGRTIDLVVEPKILIRSGLIK